MCIQENQKFSKIIIVRSMEDFQIDKDKVRCTHSFYGHHHENALHHGTDREQGR
jgi:hypothetical protein